MPKWSSLLLLCGLICPAVMAQSVQASQRSLVEMADAVHPEVKVAVNESERLRERGDPALAIASAALLESALFASGVGAPVAVAALIYDLSEITMSFLNMGNTVTSAVVYKGIYDSITYDCPHGKILQTNVEPAGLPAIKSGGVITATQREAALIGAECECYLHKSGQIVASWILRTTYNGEAWAWMNTPDYYVTRKRDSQKNSVVTAVPCSLIAANCPSGQYLTGCGGADPVSNIGKCTACTCPAGQYASGGCTGTLPPVCTAISSCKKLVFTTKPGDANYASCDGTYVLDPRSVNGKPIYTNAAKSRFLFYNTQSWVLTGTQWLNQILATGGYFGGFHFNSGASPLFAWDSYTVVVTTV